MHVLPTSRRHAHAPLWRFGAALVLLLPLAPACGGVHPNGPGAIERATSQGDGASAGELLVAGVEWARRGDSVRAEHYLVAALERGASEKKTVPLLVAVCVEGSRFRAALEHAEPYLRTHPEEAELRLLVASIYLGLGRVDDARSSLEEVLRVRPRSGAARYFLGSLYAREFGEVESASHEFRLYLQLEPAGAHAAEVRAWLRRTERLTATPSDTPGASDRLPSTEDPA